MAKQLFLPSESIDRCSLTQASLSYNIWGRAFLKMKCYLDCSGELFGAVSWLTLISSEICIVFDTCLLLASSVTLFLLHRYLLFFSFPRLQPGTLYLGLTVYSGSSGAFSGLPGSNKN